MKRFKLWRIGWGLLFAALFLPVSCMTYSEDFEDTNRRVVVNVNGMVTVKTLESGTVYFQLDEKTTLHP
ncbi:MAG: hypothetical protein IIU20_06800, partial [Bacteroidales bacterium]|nr:hypothetical protein [Bacteroidales bacterium]